MQTLPSAHLLGPISSHHTPIASFKAHKGIKAFQATRMHNLAGEARYGSSEEAKKGQRAELSPEGCKKMLIGGLKGKNQLYRLGRRAIERSSGRSLKNLL